MGANALTIVPLILGAAVAIFATVVSLPVLCAFVLSGRAAREEDEILADELTRKPTPIKSTPRTRPYIRETHTLDYSTMTGADIAQAFKQESTHA